MERQGDEWHIKPRAQSASAEACGQAPRRFHGSGACGRRHGAAARRDIRYGRRGRRLRPTCRRGILRFDGSSAMKVAVLGGGPSGAFAAEKLASAGVQTVVFDEKLAWEKPCGGGLTWKAYSQYPFLPDSATPKKIVTETVLAAPESAPVTLKLDQPLLIFSRYDLNAMLLDRAQHARARRSKDARAERGARRARLAAPNQNTAPSMPITASSRPARAILCAISAPS